MYFYIRIAICTHIGLSWTCIIMMLMSFGSSFQTPGGLPIYRDNRGLTTDMQFVSLRIYSCEKSIDQPSQIIKLDMGR